MIRVLNFRCCEPPLGGAASQGHATKTCRVALDCRVASAPRNDGCDTAGLVRAVLLLAALLVPNGSARAAASDPAKPGHAPAGTAAHRPVPAPAHKPARPAPAVHSPVAAAPAAVPAPVVPAAPAKGSVTGLALPRFAALKSDEVNLRSGPGLRYPIEWVYKRRDLPVQIEREFEMWRLISDQDGGRGWVNQATLTGRRTFVVMAAESTVRSDAGEDGAPVARLKPGVVGRIRTCDAGSDWCQVQVGDYRGWLRRNAVWGIYPDEAVQ